MLLALPPNLRLPEMLKSVSSASPPATIGSIVMLLSLPMLVSALLRACVTSCSTTVSTSPGRKARLSDTNVQGVCGENTPPASPRGVGDTGGGGGGSFDGACGGNTTHPERANAATLATTCARQRTTADLSGWLSVRTSIRNAFIG